MTKEELDVLWDQQQNPDPEAFYNKYIATGGEDLPECYGTGDERAYCDGCPYQSTC